MQIKLFSEEIRKEFINSKYFSLQSQIGVIGFAHVSSLFLKSNKKI